VAFTSANGRTTSSLADINITPLVDVVLVLLVIFMVTAPVLQSGIDVSVPKTRTVKEISEERLVISIDKQQRVFLGNDAININEIGAKLRQKVRDPAITRSSSGPMKTSLRRLRHRYGCGQAIGHWQCKHRDATRGVAWRQALKSISSTRLGKANRRVGGPARELGRSHRRLRPLLSRRSRPHVGQWRKRRSHERNSGQFPTSAHRRDAIAKRAPTESKGLSQSQPVAQTKEPDAIDIPDKNIKKKVTKPVNSTVNLASRNRNQATRFRSVKAARRTRSAPRAARDLCRSAAAPAISAAALATMCG